MKDVFKSMRNALRNLEVVHEIFGNEENFGSEEKKDYFLYKQNEEKLKGDLDKLAFNAHIYN